jgi:hypothetical protein
MSLEIIVGGVSQRPRVTDGQVTVRDVLDLTVAIDHNVVDGAPAPARFDRPSFGSIWKAPRAVLSAPMRCCPSRRRMTWAKGTMCTVVRALRNSFDVTAGKSEHGRRDRDVQPDPDPPRIENVVSPSSGGERVDVHQRPHVASSGGGVGDEEATVGVRPPSTTGPLVR